ncbi:MAG TPA: PQQ-dependent dehydrogenase, methanol/ethanol family [Acidobacteria bacterium]|nr:PQQ-dependent dehydrogenase, methanol/ethanol family [Acidobacteriota bacterium]
MTRRARFAPVVLALAVALTVASVAPANAQRPNRNHWTTDTDVGRGDGPVDDEALKAAPANSAEWLHYGGNYQGWRHSPIEQLTPQSVGNLKLAWMAQTGVPGQLEASPVIYDGILYLTSARNRLLALDAKTGALHWRYDHPLPDDLRLCCGPANRGVAIAGDVVIMATLDAKLVAFDRRTGTIAWETTIDDHAAGFSATSAPLVIGDVAVIGVGGGEYGVRGYFDGYDVATGERRWRHYTIPAAGEPGIESWAGESYLHGGGATWSTGSYDAETDTLFWTTGNPSPDWNGDDRLGDNLYSDSVLAVDPSTGERKWHFQFTPHDVWDYDGNSEIWLVDVSIDGQTVPALAQANRNGYLYLLDRRDGRFLRATQYADQVNWGTVGADGRATIDPAMMPAENPEVRVCPGLAGGNNAAYSGAVNPDLGLAFVPVIESCMMFRKARAVLLPGIPYFGGSPAPVDQGDGSAYGHLSAIDLATGETRWKYRDPYPMMAGVLSTAGGLVVTGNAGGDILGFDARTGDEVWRVQTGSGIRSHPVAYELDGVVYLAVGSGGGGVVQQVSGSPASMPLGSSLLVFALEGS